MPLVLLGVCNQILFRRQFLAKTNSPAPVVIGGQNVVTNPITGTQMFLPAPAIKKPA